MLGIFLYLIFTNWRHRRRLHVNSQKITKKLPSDHNTNGCDNIFPLKPPPDPVSSFPDLNVKRCLPAFVRLQHRTS
jgi:hypothetical protein